MEVEQESSPRISFSADLLDDDEDFICITPISPALFEYQTKKESPKYTDFEFLLDSFTSPNTTTTTTTADQLFFDGKLLPFSNQSLTNIRLKEEQKSAEVEEGEEERANKQKRIVWTCVDEDPSPKPPTCTLLWKELLRLKKQQRASSASSSSSSSLSPSPSSCSSIVIGDLPMIEEGKEEPGSMEKHIKWLKKGLEKTRRSTSTTRIRPMSNVPTPSISSPPLFPLLLKKVRVSER